KHDVAAAHRRSQRFAHLEVTDHQLDAEALELRGVTRCANKAPYPATLAHETGCDAPADEPAGARDQACLGARGVRAVRCARRCAHRRRAAARRRIVAEAMSRTIAQFLL